MALEGPSIPLEESLTPDEFGTDYFGPIEASGAAYGRVLMPAIGRDRVIDGAWVRVETKPSVSVNMLLVAVADGQSVADAVTANQDITAAVDLNGLTDATKQDLTLQDGGVAAAAGKPLIVPAGYSVAVYLDGASTDMVGLSLGIRSRTRKR